MDRTSHAAARAHDDLPPAPTPSSDRVAHERARLTAEWLARFDAALAEVKDARPSTRLAYATDVRIFAEHLARARGASLAAATRADAEGWMVALAAAGTAAASRTRKLSALHAFYTLVPLAADPTAGLERPRLASYHRTPTRARHGEALLAEVGARPLVATDSAEGARATRDRALMLLLADCGLRASLLLRLPLVAYDSAEGTLTYAVRHRRAVTVPLAPATRLALEAWLLARGRWADRTRAHAGALFLTDRGTTMTRQGLWKIVRGYARRAGLPASSSDDLRQAGAARALAAGTSHADLAARMGHVDVATTQHLARALAR